METNYNLNEMLARIDSQVADMNNAEEREMKKLAYKIEKYESEIRAYLPQLNEVKVIANKLAAERICNSTLITDSWTNVAGFFPTRTIWAEQNIGKTIGCYLAGDEFGVMGGGACGDDIRMDLESGKIYIVKHAYDTSPSSIRYVDFKVWVGYLGQLHRGLPVFFKRMENLMNNPSCWERR